MRSRVLARWAALGGAAAVVVLGGVQTTTAAWTDPFVATAQASAAEVFGCQQPVVVTTLESPPAQTVTVRTLSAECEGSEIEVQVYDPTQGGEPGTSAHTASFESGADGWYAFGGGSAVEPSTAVAHGGAMSLRSYNRNQTYQGPGRDLVGLVTPGETYLVRVWVYHEQPTAQQFSFTLRDLVPQETFTRMVQASVPPNQWTMLGGMVTFATGSTAPTVYIEAFDNATMPFFIDSVSVDTLPTPSIGGWVEAVGTVDATEPTLSTDVPFTPIPGDGAMEVHVTIDGRAVPAVWVYEQADIDESCQVVYSATLEPVPDVTCEGFEITLQGTDGPPGNRVVRLNIGFTAPGTATDGSQEIVFTTDLSTAPGVPGDWNWASAVVESGSMLPYPGYSCSGLPLLTAISPGWAVNGTLYFELHEQPSGGVLACSP